MSSDQDYDGTIDRILEKGAEEVDSIQDEDYRKFAKGAIMTTDIGGYTFDAFKTFASMTKALDIDENTSYSFSDKIARSLAEETEGSHIEPEKASIAGVVTGLMISGTVYASGNAKILAAGAGLGAANYAQQELREFRESENPESNKSPFDSETDSEFGSNYLGKL